jgi:hypothetical protein
MILMCGMQAVANNTSVEIILSPLHRFTALAFECNSPTAQYFGISSCKFGDLEIIQGGMCTFEVFTKLFPQLDVSERTCLDEKTIVLQIHNLAAMSLTLTFGFAGWEG